MILIILISLFFQVHSVFSAESRVDPLVPIEQGLVRGQIATDGDYSIFLGIPYAQVDFDNPFGAAVPHQDFGGETFNAFDGSIRCPQPNFMKRSRQTATNNEQQTLDCLRLNIFTPNEASSRNLMPVLVHIHGGGFEVGGALEYGVHKFMEHGIVIVSINYRLGPYGFMCLDSPLVPGNQGLKDQYEALRWIQNNIAAFGGNPADVTISGGSAGSCSVLLQLYSPKEKLFNKVIAQSGTPQNEGMFVNGDITVAIKIAQHLGFNATDTEQALNFLSGTPYDLVIASSEELNIQLRPCKERQFSNVDNFVGTDPYSLSNEEKIKNTPILIGHTSKEHNLGWLLQYGEDYFDRDPFYEKLKNNFNLNDDATNDVSNIVKHFYIGDEPVSIDLTSELADFDSDFVFNHSVQRIISYLLKENANPVFQYVFSYVGASGEEGAPHGSEVKYLFDGVTVLRNEEEQLLSDRMTALWANFVKLGNPTPEATDLLPITWEPVTTNTRPYLDINSELQLKHRVYQKRMAFWDLFYYIYKNDNSLIEIF